MALLRHSTLFAFSIFKLSFNRLDNTGLPYFDNALPITIFCLKMLKRYSEIIVLVILCELRKQGPPLTGREDGGKAQSEWRRSAVMTPAARSNGSNVGKLYNCVQIG